MPAINIASAKADYKNEESTKPVSLEIMDGAREPQLLLFFFLTFQTDSESESHDGFEKTVDLVGERALVKEATYNDEKNSEIQWINKKRYIITLKGTAFSYEELNALKKKLNLSALE